MTTTALCVLATVAASPAWAQEAQPTRSEDSRQQTPPASQMQTQTQTAPQQPASDASDVQTVVVTGSRIRRNEFTSPAPIQVITSEQAALEGLVDTGELLQQATVAAGSYQINNALTGYLTTGGPGANTLSLRGLGAQRTLFLLNGRRAGPAGVRGNVGPFDLNVIPSSMIDRVEILKDGASSIYGSDAIAGVVNIITRTNKDGADLTFHTNQPFAGGGERFMVSGGWGATFDNGFVQVAGSYYKQEPLLRRDRPGTACAADYLFHPQTRERLDWRGLDGSYKCYNLTTGFVQAAAFGNIMPAKPGVTYPTPAQGNNAPAGWARFMRSGYPATFPYAPTESEDHYGIGTIYAPVTRYTVSANGALDLSPTVELYGEALFNRRESKQLNSAQIFQTFAQRNIVFGAPNTLPASNPNNPFGVNVLTVSPYRSDQFQEVEYTRAVVGLRGQLPLLGGWGWDLHGQFSKSDGRYTFGKRMYLDRFLAVNSSNVACEQNPLGGNVSGFNCADLPNGVPWTSARILSGQFTPEEEAFLFFKEYGTTTYEHKYVEGTISGDLFRLPAGMVGAAFGFQVRDEALDDTPGPQAAMRNQALFSSAGRTAGDDSVKEVFGELEVPIFRGAPFAEAVTLNVSSRFSDYKSYGESLTYKAGLNWAITPAWRVRATQGTSFRAPGLFELYLGSQIGFGGHAANDPCYNYGTSGVNPTIQANCASLGIPDNYVAAGAGSIQIVNIGGAGNLEAETAKAKTVGLIWTPQFIDLSVAVDYFEIEVRDEIRQFGALNIMTQCYSSTSFPNNPFCGLHVRDPNTFYVLSVDNSYVNVARQNNRGLDLTVRYRHETPVGRLTLDGQATWQLEATTKLLGASSIEDFNGTVTEPDFNASINARLDRGPWTFFWGVDMIGKASDTGYYGADTFLTARYADIPGGVLGTNCAAPNNYCAYYKQYTEFTTYHSTSVRYNFDNWTLQAGVQNVFDDAPPAVSSGVFRVGTSALNAYDYLGRRGFVTITKKW